MKTIRYFTMLFFFTLITAINLNAQEEKKPTFKPSMKMGGLVMYDFNFLSAGDYSCSGNEFRRVRLAAKGNATKNIGYKVEFDFAGGAVNFRDVYFKFSLPNNIGNLKVGSFTEPSNLDNMTSGKYTTFFERAMLVNTQPFKYNAGFMYDNQNLLDGKIGLQMSYTFNGDKSAAFIDKSLDEGGNFVGRLTGNILNDKEKKQVVHLGVNYEYRAKDSDFYHYKFRTENHMGDKFSVGTQYWDDDELKTPKAYTPGVFKNTSDIGFEIAATQGALSLQGEYEASSIVTNVDTYKTSGYYAFASFFLTGEHRPYKKSTFGRIKPKADFCLKDGNYGAFEIVARYSVIDFSNYSGVTDTNKIANITAGFNWYLSNNTRIMYNYTNANDNDINLYDGSNLTGHLIRLQVDF